MLKTLSALPILTFIMLVAPLQASAADLPRHRIVPSVQSYGDSNKSCTSWTDGCVTCKRDGKAESCLLQHWHCLPAQGSPLFGFNKDDCAQMNLI
jgi:hypothetical protein